MKNLNPCKGCAEWIIVLIIQLGVCTCSYPQDVATPYDQLVLTANSQLKQGQLDAANQTAQQAIQQNPDGYTAYAIAAKIAARQGNTADVANDLQKALQLAPDETSKAKVKQSADLLAPATNPGSEAKLPQLDQPCENSLGMKFVSVPGSGVLFCIWDVRVQDFEAFVNATGYDATGEMYSLRNGNWGQNGKTWKSPGFVQGPTHPVCGVSWNDAQAFCAWLTKKERGEGKLGAGQSYRLPQETEWDLAVGNIKYPWGDAWPPPEGADNYAGTEAKDGDWPSGWRSIDGYKDGYARTSPVGSFNANSYGLYDMGGNVYQWCEDWDDSGQQFRVLRGVSWGASDPAKLLSSCRRGKAPDGRGSAFGFRVVLASGFSENAGQP